MQKWRSWEAASQTEWAMAVEREAVIRPLAEQARLSWAAIEDAIARLQLSRSVLYDLVRRYRRRPQTSSLLPWKRGRGATVQVLAPEREELLQACIREFYLTPERPVHSTLGKTPLLPAVPRIIQRDGVHFHGIRYWDSVLSPWAGRLKKPLWIKYDPRNLARVYVRDSNGKHWPVPYADLRQPPIALWELMEARKRLRQSGKADPTERALSANILQQRRLVKEAVSQSQQRRRKEGIPSIAEIQPTGAEPGRSDRVSYDIQPYPFEIWERE